MGYVRKSFEELKAQLKELPGSEEEAEEEELAVLEAAAAAAPPPSSTTMRVSFPRTQRGATPTHRGETDSVGGEIW